VTARIIEGQAVAAAIREELKARIGALKARGITPGLGVILVGDDPASVSYVTGKARACRELGMFEETVTLPGDAPENLVLSTVDRLNADPRFHGILVQLPVPKPIDADRVINRIRPEKDADGLHPANAGKLLRGEPCAPPCTPAGIQEILIRSGCDPDGRHVVICGRSNLVGKPLMAILCQKKKGCNATVTLVHTGTPDMGKFTRQADILVAAMGVPRAITADMVRPGAVVIDVGVNRVPDASRPRGYRLVGDTDFEAIKEIASAITPVPGGVGPMTVTMLLKNTVDAAERAGR
jgi:methylenetetrahydrofolate dehydrogenase (NADP+)/methenyltetrahydrofolate cyclohydrolase